jgi:hypothetical protein
MSTPNSVGQVQSQTLGPGFVIYDYKGLPACAISFANQQEAEEARRTLVEALKNVVLIERSR